MTIIETYSFPVYEKENSSVLRFPLLRDGAFSFSVQSNYGRYVIELRYNIFSENVDVSVYSSSLEPLAMNQPLKPNANFLIGNAELKGYTLYFDSSQNKFIFANIN